MRMLGRNSFTSKTCQILWICTNFLSTWRNILCWIFDALAILHRNASIIIYTSAMCLDPNLFLPEADSKDSVVPVCWLVVNLAGALFYATVTFSFFCSVQKYCTLNTRLSTILAKCTLEFKTCTFPPLKTKAKPNYTPPIFITSHTPPVHGNVWPVLGASISVCNLALK